jgi:hypothetical protein
MPGDFFDIPNTICNSASVTELTEGFYHPAKITMPVEKNHGIAVVVLNLL